MILGIDYGTKRIGIALSDASEVLAFPATVIPNGPSAVGAIKEICEKENARIVVLGLSQDSQQNDNPVMENVRPFKKTLEDAVRRPVIFQEESWSSTEARKFQGRVPELDASAAAIILQRFLDKERHK